jgi:D-alanine--poly(phosphoribitol) ligase subunit 1
MTLSNRIENFLCKVPSIYDTNGSLVDSYQFIEEYKCIKAFLFDKGLDSIISIHLEKDYQYIICMIACMDLGITYVPLSIDYPEKRIDQIKDISGFTFKIDYSVYKSILTEGLNSENITYPKIVSDTILYILFTSGSSGAPKGVEIKRSSYENFLQWMDYEFDVSEKDVLLNSTEFTFDVSLVDVGFLINNQPTLVMSNFKNDLFRLLGEIEQYKVSVIATVPNNFALIFKDEIMSRVDVSYLNTILVAGSRFNESLYHNFKKYLPESQVYNCYGPTELTIYCLFKKFGDMSDINKNVVSIGLPLLNMNAVVVDQDYNLIDNDYVGELLVSGPQLMNSYKNNPKKSLEATIHIGRNLFYKTGDLVYRTDENFYYMVGRVDDTVKVSGFRVNLSDVDSYIQSIEKVFDSVSIYIENENSDGMLVSYLIIDECITTDEIKILLKSIVPSFQVPKHLIKVDSFPLNNSGKICKKTLTSQFTNN